MKTNKFWLGALALLATGVMASCSNEEPAVNPDNGTEQVGDKYMAVRISMPTMMGTRAEGDEETGETNNSTLADGTNKVFEEAVGNESAIDKANVRFYFYTSDFQPFTLVKTNVNGTVEETNMVTPQSLTIKDQDGNVTYQEGILVLGTPSAPYIGKTPKYVACAINLTDAKFREIANKTMNDIENINIVKSPESDGTYKWNLFAMTSSTYADEVDAGDGKGKTMRKVIAAEIKEGMLTSSVEAAEKNPVNIYVERLVSKVRVKGLDTYTSKAEDGSDATYDIIGTDGTKKGVTLKVELTGWQLRNRNMYAKLFKYINKNATAEDYFSNWNDPNYHRCYWAETPVDDSYLVNDEYDIYSADQFKLGNYDADDATLAQNYSYTYPSTAWQPASSYVSKGKTIAINPQINRDCNATAVVVKGVVKLVNEDGSLSEGLDLVYWGGGYYTLAAFNDMVINAYNTKHESELPASAVKLVATGNNLMKATVVSGEINDNVEDRFVDISYWKNGVTSYYINIKHANKVNGDPLFGLVRNHIYENNISGVVGLGVPGNDPKNPEDETESYLACTINVLNWRVVSDNIVLGK